MHTTNSRDIADPESALLSDSPPRLIQPRALSVSNGDDSFIPLQDHSGISLKIWRISRIFVALLIPIILILPVHRILPRPLETGTGFQEAKALEILEEFATRPHAYGSAADLSVATLLTEKMRNIAKTSVGDSLASVVVQDLGGGAGSNIIGILHGSSATASTEPFAMVSAHFDSVPAGPGATDDGVGAAVVVEAFRIFVESAETQRFPCDILFALVDGEEVQLIGSTYFMTTDYGRRARVVVNLEGSGAASTEYLIRTNSQWFAGVYAGNAPHPAAYSIAEKLFSVFGAGYTDAMNYAAYGAHVADLIFVDNRFVYHTAADSVENIMPGALQHEGDNVVSLLRAAASMDLPDPFIAPVKDPIKSGSIYFAILRSVVWCSGRLAFQLLASMLAFLTLLSLAIFYSPSLPAALCEARWILLNLFLGMCVQSFAALCFVGTRDVRSWYWSANTVRVLHPAVWLLFIASLSHKYRLPEADEVCKGCLLVAAVLNLLFILFFPEIASASIWALLPTAVPVVSTLISRHSKNFQHYPDRAHMSTENQAFIWLVFSVLGLLFVFDNVFSWIPTFLFYLDSMRSPTIVAELLASLIATFTSLLLWPFIAALRSDESKVLVIIATLAVIAVTIAELSVPTCRTCSYPVR